MYPPVKTVLRKVDVYEFTLTLDLTWTHFEWHEPRLIVDRNKLNVGIDNSVGVDNSFGEKLWMPQLDLYPIKSIKAKKSFSAARKGEILDSF